jgi:predicted nicotinamide N-methyase
MLTSATFTFLVVLGSTRLPVAWPSAVALAHWVVSNPAFVAQSAQVLEIGAGCGLVSIVAALIRKRHAAHEVSAGLHHQSAAVTVTDFNPVVLRNLESNVALNDVCEHCQVMGLDFNQQTLLGSASGWVDTESQLHPPVDLILAADIICQPEDAYGVALLIRQSLRSGGQAVVVCADSGARFGVDHFAPACQKQGLRVSVTANEDLWSEQLAKNVELTSGYVPGMKMNTFRIHL